MKKPFSKLLLAVGVATTAFFIIDLLAWVTTGLGLLELLGGDRSPVMIEIANQVKLLPMWGFWLLCLVAIVLLSTLLSLIITSMYKEELTQK